MLSEIFFLSIGRLTDVKIHRELLSKVVFISEAGITCRMDKVCVLVCFRGGICICAVALYIKCFEAMLSKQL